MTKKQFLLLFFLCGGLFRAVPQPQSYSPEPPVVAEAPAVETPGQYFTSVQSWSEVEGSTPQTKFVLVTVEVENGETHKVDFKGYFSPYMAKVKDSSSKFRNVTFYRFEGRDLVDASGKTEVFTHTPFEKGEARYLSMAFEVPKKTRPTEVLLPTQDGPLDIALPLDKQKK